MHALWLYEQTRLPVTAEIVHSNRRGGPEGVIDAVEARAPDGFSNIEDACPSNSARRSCVVMRPRPASPANRSTEAA